MFLSREEKESRKQLKEEIQKINNEILPLKQQLRALMANYRDEVEQYAISKSIQWEYSQVNTTDEEFAKKIVELGQHGWEMIGVTSYSIGASFGGSGNYSVHFLYAFKRPLYALPEELIKKHSLIVELQNQIHQKEVEIEKRERILASNF